MSWRIFHGAYFAGPLGREEKTQCLSCRYSGGKGLLCEDAHGPQAPAVDKTRVYRRARRRDQEAPGLSQTQAFLAPALGGLQRQQQPEGGFRRAKTSLLSLPPSLVVRRGFTGCFSGSISQGCFSPLGPPSIFTNSFIGNMSPLLPLPTVQGGCHVQGPSGVVAENTQPAKLKMLPLASRWPRGWHQAAWSAST